MMSVSSRKVGIRGLVLACVAGALSTALTVAAGCSSTTNGGAGASPSEAGSEASAQPDSAAPTDAASPGDGGTNRVLTWQIEESPTTYGLGDGGRKLPDGGAAPLPPVTGAQVCAYLWGDGGAVIPAPDGGTAGNIGCTTTDAQGNFALPLPAGTDVVLTVTKAGYNAILQPIETSHNDMDGVGQAGALLTSRSSDPPPPINKTIDWQHTGQVGFFVIGPAPDGGNDFSGDPGAVISLGPSAGDGPYYMMGGDFQLDASTVVDAQGWFYNVPPGAYDLKVADSKHDCAPISFQFGSNGFPLSNPPHTIAIPVVAGYTTLEVGLFCTDKPPIVNVDGGGD